MECPFQKTQHSRDPDIHSGCSQSQGRAIATIIPNSNRIHTENELSMFLTQPQNKSILIRIQSKMIELTFILAILRYRLHWNLLRLVWLALKQCFVNHYDVRHCPLFMRSTVLNEIIVRNTLSLWNLILDRSSKTALQPTKQPAAIQEPRCHTSSLDPKSMNCMSQPNTSASEKPNVHQDSKFLTRQLEPPLCRLLLVSSRTGNNIDINGPYSKSPIGVGWHDQLRTIFCIYLAQKPIKSASLSPTVVLPHQLNRYKVKVMGVLFMIFEIQI